MPLSFSKLSPTVLRQRLINRLADRVQQRAFFASERYRQWLPELSYGRHLGPAKGDARPAAVLALLYPKDGVWQIPAMVRPESMTSHGGQVALPGGMLEVGETPLVAAVREYEEELGATADGIELLGELAPVYVFNSNFLVTPILGMTDSPPQFAPNAAEVDQVLELSLTDLASPNCRGSHLVTRRGLIFKAPHFEMKEKRIWGATSLILAEVLALAVEA